MDERSERSHKCLVNFSLIHFLWPFFTPKRCNFPQITLINVTVRQLDLNLDGLDFVFHNKSNHHPVIPPWRYNRDEYSSEIRVAR